MGQQKESIRVEGCLAQASTFELDRFRDRIQKLYIKENKPLKDIMKILSREGCHASRNMYLKKIQAWGLKKNKKHVVQETQKTYQTYCSGFAVTERLSLPLWKGYTGLDPWSNVLEPESPEMPYEYFRSIDSIQTEYISMHLTSEPIPSHINNIVRQEFCGSILVGLGNMSDAIHPWQRRIAGAYIERGMSSAEVVLRSKDPHILAFILILLAVMKMRNFPGLEEIFLKYLQQLSRILWGPAHPLNKVIQVLLTQNDHSIEILLSGMRLISDATAKVAGNDHPISLMLRKALVNAMVTSSQPYWEVCHHYEALLKDCEKSPDKQPYVAVSKDFASYVGAHGDLPRAFLIYRKAGYDILYGPPSRETFTSAAAMLCSEWGRAAMFRTSVDGSEDEELQKERFLEAEDILKRTVERAILFLGPQDVHTIDASMELSKIYSAYGMGERSQVQVEFIQDQLEKFTLTEEKDVGGAQ